MPVVESIYQNNRTEEVDSLAIFRSIVRISCWEEVAKRMALVQPLIGTCLLTLASHILLVSDDERHEDYAFFDLI